MAVPENPHSILADNRNQNTDLLKSWVGLPHDSTAIIPITPVFKRWETIGRKRAEKKGSPVRRWSWLTSHRRIGVANQVLR